MSDEAVTAGQPFFRALAHAPAHDWLNLTGGAIGQGIPVATGAALAAPDRRVLCVVGDGSALYTPQALWTQARERLDVTTMVLANRSYAILNGELQRVGAHGAGETARRMLDLGDPAVDFVAIGTGFGVPSSRVRTVGELVTALRSAYATSGPALIEVALA